MSLSLTLRCRNSSTFEALLGIPLRANTPEIRAEVGLTWDLSYSSNLVNSFLNTFRANILGALLLRATVSHTADLGP
jgi:hypothetical protein